MTTTDVEVDATAFECFDFEKKLRSVEDGRVDGEVSILTVMEGKQETASRRESFVDSTATQLGRPSTSINAIISY